MKGERAQGERVENEGRQEVGPKVRMGEKKKDNKKKRCIGENIKIR